MPSQTYMSLKARNKSHNEPASTQMGIVQIPHMTHPVRRPLLHSITAPAMRATPTLTYGSPLDSYATSSPQTFTGTPSRMIQIQQGTPHAHWIQNGLSHHRSTMANSPDQPPEHVPFNSPIDLAKGNPLRMGVHPVLRGLKHTPESHGWNAFSALITSEKSLDRRGTEDRKLELPCQGQDGTGSAAKEELHRVTKPTIELQVSGSTGPLDS